MYWKTFWRRTAKPVFGAAILVPASHTQAHVKWFSDYASRDHPVHWTFILSNHLVWAVLASFLGIFLAKLLWAHIQRNAQTSATAKTNETVRLQVFSHYVVYSALVATLLLCWKNGLILAPELACELDYIYALQFSVLLVSLIPRLRFLFPFGIALLFLGGIVEVGVFHMIDYVFMLGAAYFVWQSNPNRQNVDFDLALLVLYRATGFALCWVGIEKLVYPHWAEQVILQAPMLTMGLPLNFFIPLSALVEFALGYLFFTQQWPRQCAVVLTGLMLVTATLFGVQEIIGHLTLHSILLVFLTFGSSDKRGPVNSPGAGTPLQYALKGAAKYGLFLSILGATYYQLAVTSA